MVTAGLIVGLATGGFPQYPREIAQVFLIVVMTFSLTEISFSGVSPRAELRGFLIAIGMNYGVLTTLLLVYALLSTDSAIRDGWVLMAAVPPAIAVVPITSYLKADVRRALLSAAFLYLIGLVLVPVITVAFARQTVPISVLLLQTLLLIGLPILLSAPLRRWSRIATVRPSIVGVSFFIVVLAVAGFTRATLLGNPELIASLSALSFLRTFGIGLIVLGAALAIGASRVHQVAATTFVSFKNLSLTIVLAFSVFGAVATLPSIVSLVFEIVWLAALPVVFHFVDRKRLGAGR